MSRLLIGAILLVVMIFSSTKKEYPMEFAPASVQDVEIAEAKGYTCDHYYGIYNCRK